MWEKELVSVQALPLPTGKLFYYESEEELRKKRQKDRKEKLNKLNEKL